MSCDQEVYENGSYWFKRFVDDYSVYGIYFKKAGDYNFVNAFYRAPLYDIRLLTIPIHMSEHNYKEKFSKYRLQDQSFFEEMKDKRRLDKVNQRENVVRGYWGLKYKMDKRLYMLHNNQEFESTAMQHSKNGALTKI